MYKLSQFGVIKTETDGSVLSIPNAEGNRHWLEYQEWLAAGNTSEPEFTDDELQLEQASQELAEAVIYLQKTDYVITKIAEVMAEGGDPSALLAEYADTIKRRKEIRAKAQLAQMNQAEVTKRMAPPG